MHTSSKIVSIQNIYAVKLDNYRDLQVYLPPSYDVDLNKRYPVLYMHDGQNVFQPARGTGESWDLHKAADRLISEGRMKEIIIVAIMNKGTNRASEYLHYKDPSGMLPFNVECKGELYEDFLINDLKPYIEANFRALTDGENNVLMGASMGGFVSYNIGLRNPNVFGKIGILSPYVTELNLNTLEETPFYKTYEGKRPIKIWLDIGEAEGLFMVRHAREMADKLLEQGYEYGSEICYYHVPDAGHSERFWAERIHAPLLYFFGVIGKPVSIHLNGRNVVGLTGMTVRTNLLIQYDSGFAMSDLKGKYIIDNPEIMEISEDGTIIPKAEGTTKVTCISGEMKVSREYTVIKELSENVSVTINVNVPVDSPEYDSIYAHGLKIINTGNRQYKGKFILPRDIAFNFKIAKGGEAIETDINGGDIEWRSFKASEDMELNYTVEKWKPYDGML